MTFFEYLWACSERYGKDPVDLRSVSQDDPEDISFFEYIWTASSRADHSDRAQIASSRQHIVPPGGDQKKLAA